MTLRGPQLLRCADETREVETLTFQPTNTGTKRLMIRFIDLRSAQIAGVRFAFWTTVTDQFIERDGYQGWDSWKEFEESCRPDEDFDRYRRFCPDWVFDPPISHTREWKD